MNETFQVYQPFRKLEIKIPPHLPAHCQCLQLLEAITRFASDLPAPNQDQIRWGSLKQTTAITKQKQKEKKNPKPYRVSKMDWWLKILTIWAQFLGLTWERESCKLSFDLTCMHPYKYEYITYSTQTHIKNNFNNVIPALWKLRKQDCFKFEVYIASRRPVWSAGW